MEAAFILVEEINPVDEVRFRGVVTQLGIDQWAIDKEAGGEEIVYLDNSSFIDESRAPAVAGNLAQVLAITRADGSLLALRISMGRP